MHLASFCLLKGQIFQFDLHGLLKSVAHIAFNLPAHYLSIGTRVILNYGHTLGANEELGKSTQIAAPTHISPRPAPWNSLIQPTYGGAQYFSAFYNFPCVSYMQW